MFDITALGELLIDFAEQGTDDQGYPAMAAHPGGAPGNFLAALSRWGSKTAFLGKVGDDAFGHLLLRTLRDAGVDVSGVLSDADVFTTLAFVTLDGSGDRSFSFARKPGADTCLRPEELRLDILEQSRAFHFGTLSLTDEPVRSATRRAVAFAREQGLLISFDPNLRRPLWRDPEDARREMLWGLDQADVVKLSDEEASFLWACSPEEAADRLLRGHGVSLAMITLGADGCLLANGSASCRVPAVPVHPVDTTGAGDIFCGSAVHCLLQTGKHPSQLDAEELLSIARFASAAAGLSTQRPGGISSIPTKEEVHRLMAQMNW